LAKGSEWTHWLSFHLHEKARSDVRNLKHDGSDAAPFSLSDPYIGSQGIVCTRGDVADVLRATKDKYFVLHVQEPNLCSFRYLQILGLPDALIYAGAFDDDILVSSFVGRLLRVFESEFLFTHAHSSISFRSNGFYSGDNRDG
jgi:hypothetical protein